MTMTMVMMMMMIFRLCLIPNYFMHAAPSAQVPRFSLHVLLIRMN